MARKGRWKKRVLMMLCLVLVGGMLAGCSGFGRGSGPSEIVIGASIPMTGVLSAFGSYEKWGYETAVKEVNDAGGIQIGNRKVPVKLILYDDESRPEKVTANVQRLITRDKVVALLGSATPPLVLAGAEVAERNKVPFVTGIAPIRAFLSARTDWQYVWDIFFDELNMTQVPFKVLDQLDTNRKVALFTDNEADGVQMGKLWNEYAPQYNYEIVYHASFPVGTTDYGDMIRRAQEAGAEIVIAQMITPDTISLWKQMETLGYKPKAAFLEKGAEPVEFYEALGKSAEGVMVSGYWYPFTEEGKQLRDRFEKETGNTYSQHIADTYVAAKVLLDAIARAGSLDAEDIAKAIDETDKEYVIGHINFKKGEPHTSELPTFMLQWQNGDTEVVFNEHGETTADIIFPLP